MSSFAARMDRPPNPTWHTLSAPPCPSRRLRLALRLPVSGPGARQFFCPAPNRPLLGGLLGVLIKILLCPFDPWIICIQIVYFNTPFLLKYKAYEISQDNIFLISQSLHTIVYINKSIIDLP
jgi:hypothetical protein